MNTALKIVRSEEGLTLVEVMIVGVIMVVMALGLSTLISNMQHAQKALEVKANINGMKSGVRSIASQPASVSASLDAMD